MNLNKVILIGRISQQPSLSQSRSGINYVRFNVAVSRDNQNSSSEEVTDFIPVVAFGNTATFVNRYFNKGDLVSIVGNIQISQFTSTKSGENVTSMSVLIDQIKSLEPLSVTQQRAERNNNNTNTSIETPINNTPQGDVNNPTFKDDKDNESDSPWELDL